MTTNASKAADAVLKGKETFSAARQQIAAPKRLGLLKTAFLKWKGRREQSTVALGEDGRFTSPTIRQWAAQHAGACAGEWKWLSGDCSMIERELCVLATRYERLMESGREALESARDGDELLSEQERSSRAMKRAQRAGFAEARQVAAEMEPFRVLLLDRVSVTLQKHLYIESCFQSMCGAYLAGAGFPVNDRQLPSLGRIADEARRSFFLAHERFLGLQPEHHEEDEHGC